jgi:N-methylhydantoinase A
VTDACVVLGWLDPDYRLADEVQLDRAAAERAIGTLGADIATLAAGIVQVATAVMARALKRVSVARGIDPRGMALLPFGGAGPLFGCALADALGMSRVVIPPHPGVLSAVGLAAAPERVDMLASLHRPLAQLTAGELRGCFKPLLAAASAALPQATVTRFADCRFAGQGFEVTIPANGDDPPALVEAFRAAHRARHGHADFHGSVELVNLRVVAERPVAAATGRRRAAGGGEGAAKGTRAIVTRDGATVGAEVWPLGEMAPGTRIAGPAILAGLDATALVEPGWHGVVHPTGAVILERA